MASPCDEPAASSASVAPARLSGCHSLKALRSIASPWHARSRAQRRCGCGLAARFPGFPARWGQNADDISGRHASGRKIAKLRERVVFQTGKPLPRIDVALPAVLVFRMILNRRLAEGYPRGSLIPLLGQDIAPFDLNSLAQLPSLFLAPPPM